jgi:hypothetical protein
VSAHDGKVIGMTKIVDNGDPARRWNMVILGDGYKAGEIMQFGSDVTKFVDKMKATVPYGDLWRGINVYRIDVASTDSGARDPKACGGTGAAPHTYFDASFCTNNIQRLLVVNNTTVHTVVNAKMPQAHMILVLVNSPIYGGSGGPVATVSRDPSAAEIALHEMGHTAFGFADEYQTYAGCGFDKVGEHDKYTGREPGQPNITMVADQATTKWTDLVDSLTPMPTTSNPDAGKCDGQPDPFPATPPTVGAYEGAGYFHTGLYRPQYDCRMRTLGVPYCAVCERVIRNIIGPHVPA